MARRKTSDAAQPEKGGYLSDLWASTDYLNFDTFKPALLEILTRGATPLTLGVFGSWGSGKTSLLHMLMKDIEDKGLAKLRTAWFTAWKYERQEALWRAFILRVIDSLYPREDGKRIPLDKLPNDEQRQGAAHLERLERCLYETVTWEEEGRWSLNTTELVKQGIKLPFWLAFHLAKLGDAAEKLGLDPKLAAVLEREVQSHHLNQLNSMEEFERIFKDAVRLILGEEGRLVVFVDDLDRCLPEKAIQILEAIKLFLDVPGTVFVLGMDREVVRRGIESHYKILRTEGEKTAEAPIDGDKYLQKLIQLPFHLPPLDVNARGQYIERLEKEMPPAFRLDETTREVFARGLQPIPRQAKRALNVFFLLKMIGLEQEKRKMIPPDALAYPLLAKTVVIQSQYPDLYGKWCQYPTLIQTLEDDYRRLSFTVEEIIHGSRAEELPSGESDGGEEKKAEPRPKTGAARPAATGLLAKYLNKWQKYPLLIEMLRYPEVAGEGRSRARFEGLTLSQMKVYVGLVGAVEAPGEAAMPAVLTPETWFASLRSGDPARIRNLVAEVKDREPDGDGPLHARLRRELQAAAQADDLQPLVRAANADALDGLGWLPEDLYDFVAIPGDANQRLQPFHIGKYPVTNAQYARFLESGEFAEPKYWRDFPAFDKNCAVRKKGWGEAGWQWLQGALKNKDFEQKDGVLLPQHWNDPRFGSRRPGAPVVGICWYEANAYCRWLAERWGQLREAERNPGVSPRTARLPTEMEWIWAAGGSQPEGRYPWDKEKATTQEEEILRRANVDASKIGRTTPVWMYPRGESTRGVWDMAGNVWEWQANSRDIGKNVLALRGGSWSFVPRGARVADRSNFELPENWDDNLGFRVVLPS